MNFKVSFIPDKAYYIETYNEIVSTLKFKKFEPILAVLKSIIGVILYFQDKYNVLSVIPFIFIFSGIFDLYKNYHEKNKWLKERLDSRIVGKNIELQFNELCIIHNGPFSNGELYWDGIKSIFKTQKGIIIKPENGFSIYLPFKLFSDNKQVDFILSKNKNCT